jgi:hypothetical protein
MVDIPNGLCYLSCRNGNQANAGAARGHRGREGRQKEGAAHGHWGMRNARNDEKRTKSDQVNRIKSDQIKPNPTKKSVQPGSRRGPLDQNWRGRNSIWVERVGCEEVVTG